DYYCCSYRSGSIFIF
nr:immunoglobulin light chain junction region [Macaca mulatta]MOX35117.1 immunoglobulin light chain junction region [Macaca mulatta]